ncbi:hypothetical protein BH24PSE2_BH24PSE2_04830 [soil metagenome]
MTSTPDDPVLEAYLRGDSQLSRAYAALREAEPAPALDRRILRRARAVPPKARPARARWMLPASMAAAVGLAIGVSVRLSTNPAARADPRLEPAPQTSQRLPAEARREKARALEGSGHAKPAGTAAAPTSCAEEARGGRIGAADDAPAGRLALIRCLRDAGMMREAQHELARFREDHPQRPIDDDLRNLQDQAP